MPQETVDLLIEARWVLPMARDSGTLERHAVAIADGRIVAVGAARELSARCAPKEHLARPAHALLPGFVNAHTRSGLRLLRGRDPRLAHQLSPESARTGTRLGIAEMLRAGITCFADMCLYPEETARVAAAARMRAVIGLPIADERSAWAENASGYLAKCEELWDRYRADPWVSCYFAPDGAAPPGEATLERVRRVADELDARVAMRLPPGPASAGLAHLKTLGLLRAGFAAIVAGELAESDVELAARAGAALILCPQASLRQSVRAGRPSAPLPPRAARFANLALGTGSPTEVLALDMLAEVRQLALASGLAAADSLRMATLGGASALGLGQETGSIEPGKAADLVCIDLATLACQPLADAAETLVWAATRAQVSDVWVAGRPMVLDGRLLAFDEHELLAGLAA